MTLEKKVAIRIRDRRLKIGMTLKAVAYATCTTPQTIQRLETGGIRLTVEWMEKIAAALGVEPIVFFDDEQVAK